MGKKGIAAKYGASKEHLVTWVKNKVKLLDALEKGTKDENWK